MAFPSHFYNSEPSFNPRFGLFDKHPSYAYRKAPVPQSVPQSAPRWEPKFDVRETTQGYELFGDFSGVSKEDVHINFIDAQTMLVHGRAQRSSQSTTAEGKTAGNNATPNESTIKTEKTKLYQATVEDVEDEGEPGTSTYKPRKADSQMAEPTQKKHTEAQKPQPRPQSTQKARFAKPTPSLTEEPAREFSRSFRFPVRVDHRAVTARFKDGILAINVPKARRQQFPFASMF